MAALIRQQLGIKAELVHGSTGEYKVLVGDRIIAQKGWFLLPKNEDVVIAARRALEPENSP